MTVTSPPRSHETGHHVKIIDQWYFLTDTEDEQNENEMFHSNFDVTKLEWQKLQHTQKVDLAWSPWRPVACIIGLCKSAGVLRGW